MAPDAQKLRTLSEQAQDLPEISAFLSLFPDNMRYGLMKLLIAKAKLRFVNEDYIASGANLTDLSEGQHPHQAISGGSEPSGHVRYLAGNDYVGEALGLRLPTLRDHQGNLTMGGKTFFALVKAKGMEFAKHAVSSNRDLVNLAVSYFRGEHRDIIERLPLVKAYADCLEPLYQRIQNVGTDVYEATYGVKFDGDRTEEQKLALALAIETALADDKAIRSFVAGMEDEPVYQKNIDAEINAYCSKQAAAGVAVTEEEIQALRQRKVKMPEVPVVVQDEEMGRMYVLVGQKFVEIPSYDTISPQENQKNVLEFLNAVPQDEAWQTEVAYSLMVGATRFKHACERWKNEVSNDFIDIYISLCTDSRTLEKVFLGPSVHRRRRVFRSPGSPISGANSQTNYDSELFLEIRKARREIEARERVKKRKRLTMHSQHDICGAQTMNEACGKSSPETLGSCVPEAFQELGKYSHDVYEAVLRNSKGCEATAIQHYREKFNVPIATFEGCLGLEQNDRDRRMLLAGYCEPDGTHDVLMTVYQDTGCKTGMELHVFNPLTKKYVDVPFVEKLGDYFNDTTRPSAHAQRRMIVREKLGMPTA